MGKRKEYCTVDTAKNLSDLELSNIQNCPFATDHGGYMTLFSCLLFLVLMSVLFLLLDGILIQEGKSRARMAETGVGEHLLANYNEVLASKYHIYFLDPRMEDVITKRAQNYFTAYFSPESVGLFRSSSLFKLQMKKVDIESFGTMQEQNYLYLKHAIREFMKYDSTKDLFQQMLKKSEKQMNQQTPKIGNIKQQIEQKEEAANHLQSIEANQAEPNNPTPGDKEQQNAAIDAQKNDPRKIIQKIMKSGVLAFVTDGKSISEKQKPDADLPSDTQKERNESLPNNPMGSLSTMKSLLDSRNLDGLLNDITDDMLTYAYIKKYFNSYVLPDKVEQTVLSYEIEYILGGQTSDQENLKYVVNRLILLRFGSNMVYAVTDAELNAQALSLATALVGITGLAPVIEGVKYTILGAVSFGEALLDVKALLSGNKVPLVKTKADWKLSVLGAANLLETKEQTGYDTGLDYEEYELLLLLTQINKKKMYGRMLDLMQVNVQLEQPGFLVKDCRFGLKMKSTAEIKTWFGHGVYQFQDSREFSY
ncbi:MAG: DUF5702 domain-containing protein [Lachnospiraceae bacterium]|nr:DUF5702 domain-containing protein [Lachnospiraceae bacterium]